MKFSISKLFGHWLNIARQNAFNLSLIYALWVTVGAYGDQLDYEFFPLENRPTALLSFSYLIDPYFTMMTTMTVIYGRSAGRLPVLQPLTCYIPAIIAYFLISIASLIGIVLLVVPGLLILGVTMITFPFMVEKQLGAIGSVRESVARCYPYKWFLAFVNLIPIITLVALAYVYMTIAPELAQSYSLAASFVDIGISNLYAIGFAVLCVAVYDLLHTDYLHDVTVFD